MSPIELLVIIVCVPFLYFIFYFIVTFVEEYIKIKRLRDEDEYEDEEWIFPLEIKYTPNKTVFYAWDVDSVFLGQSDNLDKLLTIVGERWNIPYENMVIRSEGELNDEQST